MEHHVANNLGARAAKLLGQTELERGSHSPPPLHLQRDLWGKRPFTGGGDDEGDIQVNLVDVPILQNNWRAAP